MHTLGKASRFASVQELGWRWLPLGDMSHAIQRRSSALDRGAALATGSGEVRSATAVGSWQVSSQQILLAQASQLSR